MTSLITYRTGTDTYVSTTFLNHNNAGLMTVLAGSCLSLYNTVNTQTKAFSKKKKKKPSLY